MLPLAFVTELLWSLRTDFRSRVTAVTVHLPPMLLNTDVKVWRFTFKLNRKALHSLDRIIDKIFTEMSF